ncbi:MAG: histidinol-phosphate aminotransferase family protein [Phycisphaerales bacterium]|nr:histidinol-phosphate aminotransferase family protein [Phycisphaerales bacterium]
MPEPTPRPASRLSTVTPYAPPGAAAPTARLRLDANEGRRPDEAILGRLRSLDAETIRRYAKPAALEDRIATRYAIDPARVIVTAGADDALDRLCRATLEPGRRAILTDPTFEMLPRYTRLAGAEVVEVPWIDRPFPGAEIEGAIDDRTGAVFLVSPNNPTGLVAPTREMIAIAERARSAVIIADLAYIEFADEDPTRELLALPNVVITRTFSKAWGLAGLRVGYAIGPAELIGWLRTVGHPYPTSGVSLALAGAALEADIGPTEAYIAQVRRERAALAGLLRGFGAPCEDSQGNFVLGRFADAWAVADGLAARGIRVRRFERGSRLADRLRITCPGDAPEFETLCSAVSLVLEHSK